MTEFLISLGTSGLKALFMGTLIVAGVLCGKKLRQNKNAKNTENKTEAEEK